MNFSRSSKAVPIEVSQVLQWGIFRTGFRFQERPEASHAVRLQTNILTFLRGWFRKKIQKVDFSPILVMF
jgi:hypothetical protein